MRGRISSFASMVSFALLCAAVSLWVRSNRHRDNSVLEPPDSVSWMRNARRFTLRTEPGRLGVFIPSIPASTMPTGPSSPYGKLAALPHYPQADPGDPAVILSQLLSRLHNDQITWLDPRNDRWIANSDPVSPETFARPAGGTPAFALYDLGMSLNNFSLSNVATVGLLECLEDPDRFAAAHVILDAISRNNLRTRAKVEADGGNGISYNGLAVQLRPLAQRTTPWRGALPEENLLVRASPRGYRAFEGRFDPKQLAQVRDYWHREYDVRLWSLHFRWIVSIAGFLPAVWCIARVRAMLWRRSARRRNLCERCGYDLRGCVAKICPECGAGSVVVKPATTASGNDLPKPAKRLAFRRVAWAICIAVVAAAAIVTFARVAVNRRTAAEKAATRPAPAIEPVVTGYLGEWLALGNIEVSVIGARYNLIRTDKSTDVADAHLAIRVMILNGGTEWVDYISWSDRFENLPLRGLVSAVDDRGNRYVASRWKSVRTPIGGIVGQSMPACDPKIISQEKLRASSNAYYGPATRDVLLLDPEPPLDVGWIDVTLPGMNVGQPGAFKVRIPGFALAPGKSPPGVLSVDSLLPLLGQGQNSDRVREFRNFLPSAPRDDHGRDGKSLIRADSSGLFLHVDRSGYIEAISFYAGTSGFSSKFEGELPRGLHFSEKRSEVERKLGKPTGRMEPWSLYAPGDISIGYTGPVGGPPDPDSTIEVITLHAPGAKLRKSP